MNAKGMKRYKIYDMVDRIRVVEVVDSTAGDWDRSFGRFITFEEADKAMKKASGNNYEVVDRREI